MAGGRLTIYGKKAAFDPDCANMIFKLFTAGLNEIKSLVETMEIDEYFMIFGIVPEPGLQKPCTK